MEVNADNPSDKRDLPELRHSDLEKLNWALLAHNRAAYALSHAQSKESLLRDVCKSIVNQKPYELAWVGFAEDDPEKTVRVAISEGSASTYTDGLKVSWSENSEFGHGPAGESIRTGISSIFADCSANAGFESWRDRAVKFGLKSVVSVPIFDANDQSIGAMLIYASEINAFSQLELILFESLAREIGAGLISLDKQAKLDQEIQDREQAQQQLSDALYDTVEAVSKTMEFRDPYTSGHQGRVALIAAEIARVLAWPKERIDGLYLAAMVHDIGKIGVPSDILNKPSRLTDLEMQMVQGHAETGYQILKDVRFPWPVAEIVRQHHERLDGSGYPRQLKADQILDEAKVLAVADTIEAMSSHRPYRPAIGMEAAMKEIRFEAGKKYDAAIVDAACSLNNGSGLLQALLNA
jgi:putative nucleotidyltransferase with HDIG domain